MNPTYSNYVLCILFLILCIVFFLESGVLIIILTALILHSFNNIEIENYLLPDNFSDWKEKENLNLTKKQNLITN